VDNYRTEYADGVGPKRGRRTFESLAEQTGGLFSERDCMLAAASDRLAGIVRVAERRNWARRRAQEAARAGLEPLRGYEALLRVRELERP